MLESLVTSLDLSQKLKIAGFPQRSMWQWTHVGGSEPPGPWVLLESTAASFHPERRAAFTAEELLRLLPHNVEIARDEGEYVVMMPVDYEPNHWRMVVYAGTDASLANACAQLYLTFKARHPL